MPRITKRLFTDLALWMIGLGLLIGLSFPFFALALGIQAREVLTPAFWAATLSAGLVAGTLNYLLSRMVVRPRLRLLASHMRMVEEAIRGATFTSDWSTCTMDLCRVPVDSEDEIGESARAFNDLVEALFRAHDVEMAVSDFSNALSSQLELDALATKALDLLLQHTGADAGLVLTESAGELIVSAHHGLRDPQRLVHSDHVRYVLRTGEFRKLEFPDDVQVEALVADFRPRELMVVPVEFKEAPLGVVILASMRNFTSDTRWLLQLFRQGFGLALNNALAHSQLQRIAALDALTGTYNRRFGMTRLNEEFNRAVRSNLPLGLLLLDIDHFKSINDTYGHLVGDRVLGRVAEAIRRAVREGDIVVRYGGEEFLMILPGASCRDSQLLAERVRRMVAETEVREGEQAIFITASLGVTSFPEDNVEGVEALVANADVAMYRAKDQGRDQVVMGR